MITADTITDEQIRELLDTTPSASLAHAFAGHALRDGPYRREARAKCADILNAREAAK